MPEKFLTAREVSRIFRVDETTVRRWCKRKIIPHIELPHLNTRTMYRFRESDIVTITGVQLAKQASESGGEASQEVRSIGGL